MHDSIIAFRPLTAVAYKRANPRFALASAGALWFALWATTVLSQTPETADEERPARATGNRHALIVIGLPGDAEHREKFTRISETWADWLVRRAEFPDENVQVLRELPALAIERQIESLAERLASDDQLWVFFLGHGSADSSDGWFHVPGPDFSAGQWAECFASIDCERQVFWLTQAASGKFLRPFARPGRVTISATDGQGEVNETRFPEQLANFMAEDGKSPELEANATEREANDPGTPEVEIFSVLDLFVHVSQRVRVSFESDNLLATEHARLDDNGDGVGTETAELTAEDAATRRETFGRPIDGDLARTLRIRREPPSKAPSEPAESGTEQDVSERTPDKQANER